MNGRATVLAIDDDDLVRTTFKRALERGGYRVVEAGDGTAGLAAFLETRPDAVLLDLRMPGRDGLEVLSEFVQEYPETPVLVVSGEGTFGDVVEALRRGAWDFVTKPVMDAELLIRAIERGIEKATLLRKNREYSESLQSTNARLASALAELRTDQQAARQLQFQLLPRDGLQVGSYTCSRRLYPSQLLSGDFVDYFALTEGVLGFYVADVAGHGSASAFMTAILTTLVGKYRESLASRGDETILLPSRLLAQLDSDLSRLDLDRHITMFFGLLDSRSGKLNYASAGAFPYPVLAQRGEAREIECPGSPLNLPGTRRFVQGEIAIEPGARLLVATDGVLELCADRSRDQRRTLLREVTLEARSVDDIAAQLSLRAAEQLQDDVALFFLRAEDRNA
jgi:serine phosphatase RsbU (regulator of sigma subunit)